MYAALMFLHVERKPSDCSCYAEKLQLLANSISEESKIPQTFAGVSLDCVAEAYRLVRVLKNKFCNKFSFKNNQSC